MKNIHIIPTEKPSRLFLNKVNKKLLLEDISNPNLKKVLPSGSYQNIYITNSEEIKEGVEQRYLDKVLNEPYNSGGAQYSSKQDVIILTTDQDLIKDGVQAIDDEFLEWFVKNPSCESVEVKTIGMRNMKAGFVYGIIIPQEEPKQEYKYIGECKGNDGNGCFMDNPGHDCECFTKILKEEPKQETLEEAAEYYAHNYFDMHETNNYKALKQGFDAGAKWQAERMYTEEEVLKLLLDSEEYTSRFNGRTDLKKWFEQFKKK